MRPSSIVCSLVMLLGAVTFAQSPSALKRSGIPDRLMRSDKGQLSNPASPLFAPAVTYPSSGFTVSPVIIADVNGDGKPDILAEGQSICGNDCATDGSVSVLLGKGDGTFQPAVTYDAGGYGGWFALADVNGDGKVDVVTSVTCNDHMDRFCGAGEVDTLLGNGDGTFQPAAVSNSGGSGAGQTIAVGDVNGDGKPDAIVSADFCNCNAYTAGLMLGNGDGTFQPATVIYTANGIGSVWLALADVNGDGKLDLISVNNCYGNNCSNFSVSVLLGNGDGTFQTAVSYSNGNSQFFSFELAVADVNGDSKPDLILVNSNNTVESMSVLLGNGDGTFQAASIYSPGGPVAVGDVNNDGKPDLVVGEGCIDQQCDMSGIAVLLGNGDGTFQTGEVYSGGGIGGYAVALGDLTGNGLTDIVVGNGCQECQEREEGNVGVLINISGGPYVVLSSSSLNFGSQVVNTSSASQKLTLTNSGGAALTLKAITASAQYSQTNNCPIGGSLAIGSSCIISVAFAPHSAGPQNGTVTIADNAPGSPQNIALSGTGQDFSMAAAPMTLTVTPGQAANYTVTTSPVNGFNQKIAFTCSGNPSGSTCTVTPSSVTLDGTNNVTASVAVVTTGTSAKLMGPRGSDERLAIWLALPGVLGVAMLASTRRRRKARFIYYGLLSLCLISLGLGMSACGGGGSSGGGGTGTPAGTYTLTVTGAYTAGSATLKHTTPVTLVVQ